MIFANKPFLREEREMKFGTLYHITLGEEGRGRKYDLIPIPQDVRAIREGRNLGLTVGKSKSGKPRIFHTSEENDEFIYLLIDTYGSYHRNDDGEITVMKFDGTEVLLADNKASGEAGRTGYYPCYLIRVPNDGKRRFIKVIMSGDYTDEGIDFRLVVCEKNNVYMITDKEYENIFDVNNEDVPPLEEFNYLFNYYSGTVKDILGLSNNLDKYNIITLEELAENEKYTGIIKDNRGWIWYKEPKTGEDHSFIGGFENEDYLLALTKQDYIDLHKIDNNIELICSLYADNDDEVLCTIRKNIYDVYKDIPKYLSYFIHYGFIEYPIKKPTQRTIKL